MVTRRRSADTSSADLASLIDESDIEDGSITTAKLDDNSVTDSKIQSQESTKITGLPTQTQNLDMGEKDVTNVEGISTVATSPTFAGSILDSINMNAPTSSFIVGDYVYVVSETSNSLAIIDVTDPNTPVLTGVLIDNTNLSGANHVFVSNHIAYVTSSVFDGLALIDVTTASTPTLLGSISSSTVMNGASSVFVSGMHAYVTGETSDSLAIIDITDPTNPTISGSLIDSINMNGAIDIHITGMHAHIVSNLSNSLAVIDISDSSAPTLTGSLVDTNMAGATDLYVSGNVGYIVASTNNALVTIDLTDSATPTLLGSLLDATNMGGASGVFVSGDHAYVTGATTDSLAIIDISAPSAPLLVDSLLDSTNLNGASSIYLNGGDAYITAKLSDSLAVIDVNGIDAHVARIGSLDVTHLAVTDNAVVANNMYVGGLNVGTSGIHSKGDASISGNLHLVKTTEQLRLGYDTTNFVSFTVTANFKYSNTFATTSVEDTTPEAVAFNSDKSKMFVLGTDNLKVYQYTLSTPGDPSTAVYDVLFVDLSSEFTQVKGLAFNIAGDRMYVCQGSNIRQYNLATGFDFSNTVTFSTNVLSTTPQGSSFVTGLAFNGDDTELFVMDNSGFGVLQYSFVTVDDLSTASYSGNSYTALGSVINFQDITFNDDGSVMYLANTSDNNIFQITLTDYNLATAVDSENNVDISSEISSALGLYYDGDGLYVTNGALGNVYLYDSIANNLTITPTSGGMTIAGNLDVTGNITSPTITGTIKADDGTELLPSYTFTNAPSYGMRYDATSLATAFSARGFDVLQLTAPVLSTSFLSVSAVDNFTIEDDPVTITVDGSETNTTLAIDSKGSGELQLGTLDGGVTEIGKSTNGQLRVASTGVFTFGNANTTTVKTDGRLLSLKSTGATKTRISLFESNFENELSIGITRALTDGGATAFFTHLDGTEVTIGTSAGDAISISSLSVTIPGTFDVTGITTFSDGVLQNPGVPAVIGTITDAVNMSSPTGVVTVGNYAYVTGAGTDSIAIIDITDKTTPVLVGSLLDSVNLDLTQYLDVVGKYAYIVSQASQSLTIVDISNATTPSVTGTLVDATNFANVMQVRVIGKYAYTINSSNTGTFSVIDISDPTTPILIGTVTSGTLFNSNGLEVVGDHAYIANTGSMSVIDISDPTSPSITGSIGSTLINNNSIAVSGQYAYCIDFFDDSFVVVDVSDPTTPTITGSIVDTTNLNQASTVVISGKYAYVQGRTALNVIDVSVPSTPVIKSILTLATVPTDLFISGKYLYSATSSSLSIVDISGIDSPSANIGSAEIGYLSVTENATVTGDLRTSGLNVGVGGIHSEGNMSTSIGRVSVNPAAIVEIHSASDLTSLNVDGVVTVTAGVATITGDLTIRWKANVVSDFEYILAGGRLQFTGENSIGVGQTYFGTGYLVSGTGSFEATGNVDLISAGLDLGLTNITTSDNLGFVSYEGCLLYGWNFGSATGGVFNLQHNQLINIASGWTLTDNSLIVCGVNLQDIDDSGSVLTTALFTITTKFGNTDMTFKDLQSNLSSTGSVFDLKTTIDSTTRIIIDTVTATTGNLFKQSILTDATLDGVTDSSPATGTITAMADNASSGTTISSTTTYFEDEEVTIIGTTSYNGTFKIFNVVAGVSFDIPVEFVANDATGSIDSVRLDLGLTTGHGIVAGDDLKIIDTDFYNGFVTALTEFSDVLTVNGTFISTIAVPGAIERELSLDKTDPRIDGRSNPDNANSKAISFGTQNNNTIATTTIIDGTYVPVVFSGITINQVTQGFRLVSGTAFKWQYIRSEPFEGVLSGNTSMLKSGATAEYRLAMSTNSVVPTFATAPHVPIEVKTSQITKPFTFSAVLNQFDTIEFFVAGEGTTDNITFTDITGDVRQ